MTTAISLASLTKRFPAPHSVGGTITAVDRVTLMIEPGELFFLLGPSGCGKTTLLRMIAGFIEPTSGSIVFQPQGQEARDVTYVPPNKRNTGMVFQSYALWPHMTVARNVAFGLEVRKVPPDERKRRVAEALAMVHMSEYKERKPNQLSGGQQQRVALARALVVRPDVLLLDEPLSNLDAELRLELRSEIRRICKEAGEGGTDITTVYVTHDQKEALSMADRIAIINHGRIEQLGPPAELYRRPNSRFVAEFLGETNFVACDVEPAGGRGATEGTRRIVTPMGPLVSAQVSPAIEDGLVKAVCSLRPEALRTARPGGGGEGREINTLSGTVIGTTYLGETAQITLRMGGDTLLRMACLNPGFRTGEAETMSVTIDPQDVVVLP